MQELAAVDEPESAERERDVLLIVVWDASQIGRALRRCINLGYLSHQMVGVVSLQIVKDNRDYCSLWVYAEVAPVACVVGRAAVLASDVTVVFDGVSELRAHERLVAVDANAVILVHIAHITHIVRIVWLGLHFSPLAIIRLDFVIDFKEAGRPAIWGLFEPVCLTEVFPVIGQKTSTASRWLCFTRSFLQIWQLAALLKSRRSCSVICRGAFCLRDSLSSISVSTRAAKNLCTQSSPR